MNSLAEENKEPNSTDLGTNSDPAVGETPAEGADTVETKKLKFNEVELSDGRIATVGRSRGKHIQNAMRIAKNHEEQVMVIASSVTTLDGALLLYEDFLEFDSNDCFAIITKYHEMMAGKSSSPPKSN